MLAFIGEPFCLIKHSARQIYHYCLSFSYSATKYVWNVVSMKNNDRCGKNNISVISGNVDANSVYKFGYFSDQYLFKNVYMFQKTRSETNWSAFLLNLQFFLGQKRQTFLLYRFTLDLKMFHQYNFRNTTIDDQFFNSMLLGDITRS